MKKQYEEEDLRGGSIMKYTISAARFFVLCIALLAIGTVATAGSAPEQKEQTAVALWSKIDLNAVTDAELVGIYREADSSLLDLVREGLGRQGLKVQIVRSEQEIAGVAAPYVLVMTIDKIELGGKRPFGRTAKVKVAYAVQNKDRFDLVKRTHEETSVSRWQNCVSKISEQLVHDVTNDIARNSGPQKAGDKRDAVKPAPAPASVEGRLLQLESLKGKGLVTQEEYESKKKEIMKEL